MSSPFINQTQRVRHPGFTSVRKVRRPPTSDEITTQRFVIVGIVQIMVNVYIMTNMEVLQHGWNSQIVKIVTTAD
jgi:hypothetical protein